VPAGALEVARNSKRQLDTGAAVTPSLAITIPRASLVRLSEFIEDGCYSEAHDLALDLLDGPKTTTRYACPLCSSRFPWFGLLETHLAAVHQLVWDEIDLVVARAA
jgi:hypothetical protein